MRLNVEMDLRQVKALANDMQRKLIPSAAATALNRVGTTVRKVAQQKIRERLAISAAVARGDLTIRRAGRQRLAVEVVASGKPIPLRDYQARKIKKGVSYRVSKTKGRRRYMRHGRPGFILERKGGHVFVRTEDDPPGPTRGRIRKVYGPSLPQYFVTRIIREAMDSTARQRWPIEFAAALRGVLLRRTGVDVGANPFGIGA